MNKIYCQYGVTISNCCRFEDCINCTKWKELEEDSEKMRYSTLAKRLVYKACHYCNYANKCNGKKCFKNKYSKIRSNNFLQKLIKGSDEL